MEVEREANEDVILIPCRNAQEEVEVAVDDIPEDVSEVIVETLGEKLQNEL